MYCLALKTYSAHAYFCTTVCLNTTVMKISTFYNYFNQPQNNSEISTGMLFCDWVNRHVLDKFKRGLTTFILQFLQDFPSYREQQQHLQEWSTFITEFPCVLPLLLGLWHPSRYKMNSGTVKSNNLRYNTVGLFINSLICPKTESATHCLTKLFPIYQNKH